MEKNTVGGGVFFAKTTVILFQRKGKGVNDPLPDCLGCWPLPHWVSFTDLRLHAWVVSAVLNLKKDPGKAFVQAKT